MSLAQRYTINKDTVVYRIIAGEAVMLNLENGYYYSLDEIGTKIWKALDNGESIDEILGELIDEYQVSDKQLKSDVIKLIARLEKAHLINKI